jgi:hypothetical protein
MRTLIALLIALMLFATTPVAADYVENLKQRAEQGDADEQLRLGFYYEYGVAGFPKDAAKTVHWYTKAAKQRFALAQFELGLKYNYGKGVPENYVRAYAWYSIAAAQRDPTAPIIKEITANRMTPAQIAEGQKLSRELWEKYVLPFQ